ncbi:response regulator [Thiorhodovibrio winogradskyi]|nr:response regulator [Thiorhodovibrio winogradskyi]MBK5969154.1 response regulator [Thiorhodovibrio winogradskyi]
MLVDDDEFSTAPVNQLLEQTFATLCVESGEEALAQFDAFRPDVMLLDIDMPGLNGYETCRRLRANESIGADEQPAVIFISSHDTLEERLQAYDSGGDDFINKPAMPDEVLRKVQAIVKVLSHQKRLQAEKQSTYNALMDVLTDLGEHGLVIHALRSSLACQSMPELAALIIEVLGNYGLTAHVQLRPPGECLTFVNEGRVTPLEESVFAHVKNLERIFQFRRQLIINFPHVSILVRNMPIEDSDRCGRLRDYLAMIGEGCEEGAQALIRTAQIEQRTRKLQATALAVERAIHSLREQYHQQKQQTLSITQGLNQRMVHQIFLMGLSELQEQQIEELFDSEIDKMLELFDRGLDFEAQFNDLVMLLKDRD